MGTGIFDDNAWLLWESGNKKIAKGMSQLCAHPFLSPFESLVLQQNSSEMREETTSCNWVPSMVLKSLIKVPRVLAVARSSPSIVKVKHAIWESCALINFVMFRPKCSTRTCPLRTPGQANTDVFKWCERQQSPLGLPTVSIWWRSFRSIKL